MERTGIWSRVGHWLRPAGGKDGSGAGGLSRAGSPANSVNLALQAEGRAPDASPAAVAQRPLGDDRMEEAYTKIIDLVGSIRSHLELQDRRAERMAPTLERLAEGLGNIPEAAKTQVALLADISKRMDSDAERAGRLETSLSQLPQIADAQRETMVSMGRQLETLNEANERGTSASDEFRQTLSQLIDATRASTSSLKQIQVDSAAQEDNLARLVAEQTRRLTLFACAAIALAAVAAAVSLLALLS